MIWVTKLKSKNKPCWFTSKGPWGIIGIPNFFVPFRIRMALVQQVNLLWRTRVFGSWFFRTKNPSGKTFGSSWEWSGHFFQKAWGFWTTRWSEDAAASCCDLSFGPRGKESCWDWRFTFEGCCSDSEDCKNAGKKQEMTQSPSKNPKDSFFLGWFKLDFCIERNRDRKHDRVGRGNQWALKKDRTKLGKRKPKWHAFLLIAWIWFKMSKYRSTVCLWSLLLNLMPPKTNSNRKSATHDTRLIKFFCWWLYLCEVNYMCIIVVERIVISNSWLMCCWYHFIDVMQIGYADWVLSKGPCWFPFKFVQRAHLSKGRTACINGTANLEWGEVTQFELRYCCGSGSASLSSWPSA